MSHTVGVLVGVLMVVVGGVVLMIVVEEVVVVAPPVDFGGAAPPASNPNHFILVTLDRNSVPTLAAEILMNERESRNRRSTYPARQKYTLKVRPVDGFRASRKRRVLQNLCRCGGVISKHPGPLLNLLSEILWQKGRVGSLL
jgi:hypothetical protein